MLRTELCRGIYEQAEKTKAISLDTNLDEYVDRKPTDWQIKTWFRAGEHRGRPLMDLLSHTATPTKYVTTTHSGEAATPQLPQEGGRVTGRHTAGYQGYGLQACGVACVQLWTMPWKEGAVGSSLAQQGRVAERLLALLALSPH